MEPEEIFSAINTNVLKILPKLSPEMITMEADFKTLGVNSLDRAEILDLTLETIGIQVSMAQFAGCKKMESLVDALHQYTASIASHQKYRAT